MKNIKFDYYKDFDIEKLKELFASVHWNSSNYPKKIARGLKILL